MPELLFEFLFQVIGPLVSSALAQAGLHVLGKRRDEDVISGFRRFSAWLLVPGYLLLGAILGGISVLLWPAHRIGSPAGQAAYLALLPLAVGAIMAAIGGRGRRRRLPARMLDRFLYGFLFAVAIGIVCHCTAH